MCGSKKKDVSSFFFDPHRIKMMSTKEYHEGIYRPQRIRPRRIYDHEGYNSHTGKYNENKENVR